LQSLFSPSRRDSAIIGRINALRKEYSHLADAALREAAQNARQIEPFIAATAVIASRVLGEDMFDVQLRGTLALIRGTIAEMQTGEGKTLAAVPAIAWFARSHAGVHVITANDYLARRDAAWMGRIYSELGLSTGHLEQGMPPSERRAAYACDITYSTANEIGFDFLRDRLALSLDQQVQRPFAAAVIDEADSILIDEARVPLVIAGGDAETSPRAFTADQVARILSAGWHFTVDNGARNVALTDAGIAQVEAALRIGNLYEPENLDWLTAIQDSLHAHTLLRRDVDYVVKNGAVEMVDEFKGRIALDRRWPAGLHTAVEVKEGVATKNQGRVLGQITLQRLVALYPRVCGMTGTASTQADEFARVYGLGVEVIPTNRPMIRVDHPDAHFHTRREKELAVLAEIRQAHVTGQPVLIGTGSVAESERLSRLLPDIPHAILNARQDENEAAIIARAGQRGAVTISTNMSGRGTDIRLGPGASEAGGLYVIGMQRHEARRIDHQLRGRAGRQGDPGRSRFFTSDEDDLLVRYGGLRPDWGSEVETVQRAVEGHHLDGRLYLQKYEQPIEGQRRWLHGYRQEVLDGTVPSESRQAQLATLRTIDDLWADYLEQVSSLRDSLPWMDWASPSMPGLGMGRRDAYQEFMAQIHILFSEFEEQLPEEIDRRIAAAAASPEPDAGERGAVWTYITTDQPFGSWSERVVRGLRRATGSTG
jgi:preprotein translocase subunit SecA